MDDQGADEESELKRSRRTFLLLVGGAVSLLIPLAGVAYMHLSDPGRRAGAGVTPSGVFERRQTGAPGGAAISPALSPAPLSPAAKAGAPLASPAAESRPSSPAPARQKPAQKAGGSLSFVRGGEDYYNEKPADPPPAAEPPAPPPQPEPAPKPAPRKAKPGAKKFSMPKLRPTNGFSDFKGGAGLDAQKETVDIEAPAEEIVQPKTKSKPRLKSKVGKTAEKVPSTADAEALMKSAGADNLPDISGMLKNLPKEKR